MLYIADTLFLSHLFSLVLVPAFLCPKSPILRYAATHTQQLNVASVNQWVDRPLICTERHDGQSNNEVRKRSRYMEHEEEHEAKKTQIEGEELLDADDDAVFEQDAPR